MATEYLFSNNATTTLAQSVSATATVLNVAEGAGALFPSPSSGQAFAVTLVDAATGLTNEICYCTSRSGDQLTVVRGREGTNAIAWSAGDTCANYITADVMESWLQESDLNGYLTLTTGDGRYVGKATGSVDYPALQAGIQKTTGNPWLSYNDGSGVKYAIAQPAGDYATNPALNTETTNRINADTNLQNQINNRVLKTGDTSSGSQFTRNKYDNGTLHWGPSWTSIIAGMSGGSSNGEYSFGLWAQALDGVYTAGILSLNGFQGRKDFRFNEDGNIFTPLGTVALETDISNLQSQINGKLDSSFVASGIFDGSQGSTTSGTIVGGTWLRVGNTLTQNLVIENIGGGTVTFPFAFSGNNNQVVVIVQDGTGSNNTYTTGSITTTGTGIHASGGGGTGRLHLTVSGPYGT